MSLMAALQQQVSSTDVKYTINSSLDLSSLDLVATVNDARSSFSSVSAESSERSTPDTTPPSSPPATSTKFTESTKIPVSSKPSLGKRVVSQEITSLAGDYLEEFYKKVETETFPEFDHDIAMHQIAEDIALGLSVPLAPYKKQWIWVDCARGYVYCEVGIDCYASDIFLAEHRLTEDQARIHGLSYPWSGQSRVRFCKYSEARAEEARVFRKQKKLEEKSSGVEDAGEDWPNWRLPPKNNPNWGN